MDTCRICRSGVPEKYLQQLKYRDRNGLADYSKILQFCLDIRFTEHDKITKKLCTKCFKKLLIFYKFKLIALENDAYFKSNHSFSSEQSVPQVQDKTLFEIAMDDTELRHGKGIKMKTEVYYIKDDLIIVPDDADDPLVEYQHTQHETAMSDHEGESNLDLNNMELQENETFSNEPLKLEPEFTEKKKKIRKSIKRCKTCNKAVADLHGHLIRVHHPELAKHVCKLCGARYRTPSLLNSHSCKLAQDLPKKIACNLCDRKYLNEKLLKIHMSSVHRDKSYLCQYCSRVYSRNSYLIKHMRSQIGKGESDANGDKDAIDERESFLCQLCPMTFIRKSDLNLHLKHHGQDRPHKCTQCDRSYLTNKGLEYHVQFAHTDTKLHQCELCARHFSSPRYLRQHMVSHNEDKAKLQCKYCKVSFVSQTACRHHEKRVHENNSVI